MARRAASLAAFGLLWLAAGCAQLLPLAMADGVSVIASDKTLGDHAYSYYYGKDCATVRLEAGRTYCREDEVNVQPRVYCYRTLGDISCYDRPDPYDGPYRRVGENDHNYARRR